MVSNLYRVNRYSLGAKVYVVGELIHNGRIVTCRRAYRAEEQQGEQAATWPAPEHEDEERRHGEQFRIDAQMVGVGETHLAEAEVVVDEEQIAPPMLLANVRMVPHHQVPLRPGAPQGQDIGAEEYQSSQRRYDAGEVTELQ